jgi:hypothetical protein
MVENAENGHVETRASCLSAFRVHVTRLAALAPDEPEPDPSEEAEAGALIEASDAASTRAHHARVEAIFKALAARG